MRSYHRRFCAYGRRAAGTADGTSCHAYIHMPRLLYLAINVVYTGNNAFAAPAYYHFFAFV